MHSRAEGLRLWPAWPGARARPGGLPAHYPRSRSRRGAIEKCLTGAPCSPAPKGYGSGLRGVSAGKAREKPRGPGRDGAHRVARGQKKARVKPEGQSRARHCELGREEESRTTTLATLGRRTPRGARRYRRACRALSSLRSVVALRGARARPGGLPAHDPRGTWRGAKTLYVRKPPMLRSGHGVHAS